MLRVLAFLLLLCGAANAQAIKAGQLTARVSSSSWVLNANGIKADLDLDFQNNRYWGCVALTDCLSLSRASSATNLRPSSPSGFSYSVFGPNVLRIDSNGLLIEEARTNLLLNSTAPATQTTGSLANGTYRLWVNGTGSAQMSSGTAAGCGTGTATNGTSVSFTISSAGTCTVTVTGSLNAFQLELGSFGTSLIVTAGSTAQRAADVISLTGQAATKGLAAKASFNQTNGISFNNPWLLNFSGGSKTRFSASSSAAIDDNVTSVTATFGSGTTAGTAKAAFGWDASNSTAIANDGAQGSGSIGFVSNQTGTVYLGNRAAGDRALNGYMQRFALSTTKGLFDGLTAP